MGSLLFWRHRGTIRNGYHFQIMGITASSANSAMSSSFFVKAKKNILWSKRKEKWKNINFITIKENFHFEMNNHTTINLTEDEKESVIPKSLPRYVYDQTKYQADTPVVLTASALLQRLDYKEEYLPLGIVLDVLFQDDNWLFVRTAHGHEGYICSDICLPLEIPRDSLRIPNHHTNTLETLKLIYEQDSNSTINYSERNIDILYLQAAGIRQKQNDAPNMEQKNDFRKLIILTIKNDYNGDQMNTLSVKKGDVVFLVHSKMKGWFWVKNERNEEGFIPAAVAGYCCF